MGLTRISMRVEPGAGSVAAARRWVVSACLGIGRPELAECAALGVSELVTNALLHARPPIIVSLGGSLDHPRIEVANCSTVPPLRRITDDPLSTTGRGIELVSMCSSMWGVEIDGLARSSGSSRLVTATLPGCRRTPSTRRRRRRPRSPTVATPSRFARCRCGAARNCRPTTARSAASCGCCRSPANTSTPSPRN